MEKRGKCVIAFFHTKYHANNTAIPTYGIWPFFFVHLFVSFWKQLSCFELVQKKRGFFLKMTRSLSR